MSCFWTRHKKRDTASTSICQWRWIANTCA